MVRYRTYCSCTHGESIKTHVFIFLFYFRNELTKHQGFHVDISNVNANRVFSIREKKLYKIVKV